MRSRHPALLMTLAGSLVGALALHDGGHEPSDDLVGAVGIMGLGVASVLCTHLALRRAPGPVGDLTAIGIGRAVTIGWAQHDARQRRPRARHARTLPA